MQFTAPLLPWLVAAVALAAAAWWWRMRRGRRTDASRSLPPEWPLSPRPVFSAAERKLYRLLRDALPHHIVLAKLSLVRFCQPHDPRSVREWYELLGPVHVSFAVCSPNGRVLAVLDLDEQRTSARLQRQSRIKQSVLEACRIRYLRCPPDHLPSIPELLMLVPQSPQSRGPQTAPGFARARDSLANTVATRRAQRLALWQDSSFFQDSFLRGERREEGWGSEYSSWPSQPPVMPAEPAAPTGTAAASPAPRPATPSADAAPSPRGTAQTSRPPSTSDSPR